LGISLTAIHPTMAMAAPETSKAMMMVKKKTAAAARRAQGDRSRGP
jgi:hypothetical protein